ncbi:MAG: DNA polymerase III subunit gamma/tau [Dehalococcoidia bacterium]
MTSQVYYRKWRPQRFEEVVGQGHVIQTLCQAVARGRIAHAYLFCGPRGTGKTSTARILAKAINCLEPQEGEPCDRCAVCQAFHRGEFVDLLELDAASNRGIDEIRSIREKVYFSPTLSRFKVYIIDEAHMLTEHASNAFLKTLEEPPPHVIFVLCTTEPQGLVPTVVSRCQRFDFRRISAEAVVKRLEQLCAAEEITAEPEALRALARSAGGSLRDAENLLEQLVVSGGSPIGMGEVQEMLGVGEGQQARQVVKHLLTGNTPEALRELNRALWEGLEVHQLHRQVLDYLRALLLLQCGATDGVDYAPETLQELRPLASHSSLPRVLRALKLLGEVRLRYDSPSPLPLELAVVEASLVEPAEAQPRPREAPPAPQAGAPTASSHPVEAKRPTSPPQPRATAPAPAAQAPQPEASSPGEGFLSADRWNTVVKALSRFKGQRFNIGALLRDCKSCRIAGETIVLGFAHKSHLERMQQELENPPSRQAVGEAFRQVIGASYDLRLVLVGENAVNNASVSAQSHLVRAALGMGARIVEERQDDQPQDAAPGPAASDQAG